MKINGIIYDPRDYPPGHVLYLAPATIHTEEFRNELLGAAVTMVHAGGSIYKVGEWLVQQGVPLNSRTVAQAIPHHTAGNVEGIHVDRIGRVHVTLNIHDGLFSAAVARRLGLSLTHAISHNARIINPLEVAITPDPARPSCRVTNTLPHSAYLRTMADATLDAPAVPSFQQPQQQQQQIPRDPVTGKFLPRNPEEAAAAKDAEQSQADANVATILQNMPPEQQKLFLDAFKKVRERGAAEIAAEKTKLEKEVQEQTAMIQNLQAQGTALKLNGDLQAQLINDFVRLTNPPEADRDMLTKSTESAIQFGGAPAILACSRRMMELEHRVEMARMAPQSGLSRELEDLGLAPSSAPSGMTAASSTMGQPQGPPPAKRQQTELLCKQNYDLYKALMM